MKTILVVDDEPEIIRVVRGYMEQAGFRVISAGDGAAALARFHSERPDLVILDLNLPAGTSNETLDGLDVARAIRRSPGGAADTPIIMLTARVEEMDRILGLELGADDYVTKPFSGRELVARTRAVLRRSTAAPTAEIIHAGPITVDTGRFEVYVDEQQVDLTPTEFTLIGKLAGEPGRVFTREQLLDALGQEYAGLERTIDSHIKNLRGKIEPDSSQPTFILTVYGLGYKFNDQL
ncbi:MAG: response regulator transcription factor [Candidatus Promineifilaceae bacterium]|nr:response regulator transcription factor [Candidatus Promineifilaceae bacterium]